MIYTIGYEAASIEDFIQTLLEAGIKHVLDIRELPQSRRKGFSKNKLAAHLSEVGLTYSHDRDLGDPKDGREAARRGEFDKFKEIFRTHLERAVSQESLRDASEVVVKQPTVLLCYERDPKCCHRAIVAANLSGINGLPIKHLGVRTGAGSKSNEQRAA